MAGIAGTTSGSKDSLALMLDRLHHRGPRGEWIHLGRKVALGCRVLPSEVNLLGRAYAQMADTVAVIDGHFYSEGGRQLPEADLLINLYRQFGTAFVEQLGGDFALCLATDSELILARDPVGLRPLFYGYKDDELYFASEMKALLGLCTEVMELPPGHVYTQRQGLRPFQRREYPVPEFDSAEEAAYILADLLRNSVEMRLKDGNVGGVLLSGGLDSSIIAYLAREFQPNLKTFTVGTGLNDSEDLGLARQMAQFLGTEHYDYIYGEKEIEQVLSQVIYYLESFDEDCVYGAVANYFAARLAAQHTDCVLCGEGADEFLGGYHELKEARNEVEFLQLTEDLIGNAYHTGLQRLDRMMAAHSLEFRPPFLDDRVTAFCVKIPPTWKVYGKEKGEKWILRKAFADLLPDNILNRVKQPFASGAGSAKLTELIGQRAGSEADSVYRKTESNIALKSEAEVYYYRLFKEKFPDDSLEKLVTRWDPLTRRQA
jgi:asparagine synthase (glutamine-hydrolysing)